MDLKVYFYIILGIGYYAFKYYQKLKADRDKNNIPQNIPSTNPTANTATPPKNVLEDLFKEFQLETYERPEVAPPAYSPYTSDPDPVFKGYEQVESNISYEDVNTKPQIETTISQNYNTKEVEQDINKSRFGIYHQKTTPKNSYLKTFSKKGGLKKAFILSEILKTKF